MTSNKRILLRTDGGPQIATGHIMRCLSIAEALRRAGAEAEFAVADETGAEILASFQPEEKPFPVHILRSDYRNPETELAALTALLAGRCDCLLIDSYFVTAGYLAALRPLVRTAYIDDLTAFDYPVDLVINYDFAPPKDAYQTASEVLTGSAYTPLRSQFRGLCPCIREQADRLLLSTGGTDDYGVAGNLLQELLSRPECTGWQFHVLTGPMHRHRAELEALAASHPAVRLHEGVRHMAVLMAGCDLAVSAAGTTLYELCAAGLPAVSFTMADNQLVTAGDMQRYASLPWAGDVRSTPDFIQGLAARLLLLAADAEARRRLSASMQSCVDGLGADRIAEALCSGGKPRR